MSLMYFSPGGGAVEPVIKGQPLSDMPIGSIIKFKVNNVDYHHIVVQQGKPSAMYDDSFNNSTTLLMRNIYESRVWHSSNVNDYENSAIHAHLNGAYLNLIEAKVRNAIKQVKIPYRQGSGQSPTISSGANGLSAKAWLLSGYELNWTSSTSQFFPADGATLSYFVGAAEPDAKRIAYLSGVATAWWSRSPYLVGSSSAFSVHTNGSYNAIGVSTSFGIRPAITLHDTVMVSLTPDTDGAYTIVDVPTSQPLYRLPVGSSIKFKVNNVDYQHLVVQHGKPSAIYDDSFNDSTVLLMKNIYENRQWHSSDSNDYANSTIHAHLNNAYLNLIESKVSGIIKQVKIPYRVGSSGSTVNSGANGLATKVFLLGGYELNFTTAMTPGIPVDGATLSFFIGAGTTDARRIANDYANNPEYWWLRSSRTDGSYASYINLSGGNSGRISTTAYGIRPAIVLPDDTRISLTPDTDGAYTLVWPDAPVDEGLIPFSYTGTMEAFENLTHPTSGKKRGYAKLKASGTLTPNRNTDVDVFLVGGGASGTIASQFSKGGGGGYTKTFKKNDIGWKDGGAIEIAVGGTIAVTIGNGGLPVMTGGANPGADTSFGSYLASGASGLNGGSGGSTNGAGASSQPGAAGGSDGSNGLGVNPTPGTGQGHTTRAFGNDVAPFKDAAEFLFAGGGGSGSNQVASAGGAGGAGGGGNGGIGHPTAGGSAGTSGTANTGGGGGGGGGGYSSWGAAGSGGSGIGIVRWGDWSA